MPKKESINATDMLAGVLKQISDKIRLFELTPKILTLEERYRMIRNARKIVIVLPSGTPSPPQGITSE